MGQRDTVEEKRVIEELMRYQVEYAARHMASLVEERARRHAQGQVYLAGMWLPEADAEVAARGLRWREVRTCAELFVVLALLFGSAVVIWVLFDLLFLP